MELLTDIHYIQRLLGRQKLKPAHSAGQNFLVAPEVVEATLLAMKGGPLAVTELGSGLGSLTQGLVSHGYRVRAIERDRNLIAILCRVLPRAKYPNLEVEENDLRQATWSQSEPYQLVGNIPYNLSGLILRRITHLEPAPERVILLVQKEVAQRATAQAPDMNLLSLAIGLWGTGAMLFNVGRNCFWPQPQVDSALIILTPDPTAAPIQEREAILKVAKTFFQAKRKQMGGLLQRTHHLPAKKAEETVKKVGITLQSRPQELSIEQWCALTAALEEI